MDVWTYVTETRKKYGYGTIRVGRPAMHFNSSGSIVLLGFVAVYIVLRIIKSQQDKKPADQDW